MPRDIEVEDLSVHVDALNVTHEVVIEREWRA